jgi:glycosyltransferase involved in cell wall biosynthesis
MKILFDHQIFTAQRFGGISKYFVQLILNLPEDIITEIGIKYSNNEYLIKSNLKQGLEKISFPFDDFLPCFNFIGKHKLYTIISRFYNAENAYNTNKRISVELLKKQDFDIFHPTYYDDYFLEYLGNKPFILDIHDMIPELFPGKLMNNKIIEKKANLAHKANHIIAVSENTKKDLMNLLDIPEQKISVIYRGNTPAENTRIKLELPDRYLLFVGERSYYKNFLFFASAISPVLQKNKDLFLICSGKNLSLSESSFLKKTGILSQTICKRFSENELFCLYKNALAFVFPSLYEGFGLPILEAFHAGCPVILSNSSCFPEIAGDAALYFDPESKDQIVKAIYQVLNDPSLRMSLVEKGKERVETFSWSKSTNQTADIYRQVLNLKK